MIKISFLGAALEDIIAHIIEIKIVDFKTYHMILLFA